VNPPALHATHDPRDVAADPRVDRSRRTSLGTGRWGGMATKKDEAALSAVRGGCSTAASVTGAWASTACPKARRAFRSLAVSVKPAGRGPRRPRPIGCGNWAGKCKKHIGRRVLDVGRIVPVYRITQIECMLEERAARLLKSSRANTTHLLANTGPVGTRTGMIALLTIVMASAWLSPATG
jgi:hypothetical protein